MLNMTCPVLATSVDPDQLASEEANWSGSALFVIKHVNLYQKPGSSNVIGWKLEVGVASKIIQHDKGSNCTTCFLYYSLLYILTYGFNLFVWKFTPTVEDYRSVW